MCLDMQLTVYKKKCCDICTSLIIKTKGSFTEDVYYNNLQKEGLSLSINYVNFTFVHMYSILDFIINDENLETKFLKYTNQKLL